MVHAMRVRVPPRAPEKADVLAQELERLKSGAFLREGQTITTGAEAIASADSRQNIQTEGQNSLRVGDEFEMPATLDELKAIMFAEKFNPTQREPSIGVVVVVERDGKPVALRVFSTSFTRGLRPVDTTAPTKDSEGNPLPPVFKQDMIYPGGQPAKDVRDVNGSILQAFSALIGKTIRVTRVDNINCQQIRRGATPDSETGRFKESDYVAGTRKLCTFAYVETAAAAETADTAGETAAAETTGRQRRG